MKKALIMILVVVFVTGIFIGTQPDDYSFYSDEPISSGSPFVSIDVGDTTASNIVDNATVSQGKYTAKLKLFGLLPIKTAKISVIKKQEVVPLGMSFGVKLYTDGVIVVDITDFVHNGKSQNPAYTAGIREGDIILSYNGVSISSNEELIEQANAHNETDDEQVIEARKVFNKYKDRYEEEIKEEKEKVLAAGGLKIIGTERHESRRIDNQLRGRSGRQGDPGESRFYIALDDDLMKIFGGDMITSVYNTLKADENMPIEMGLLSKTVENAQKRVEGKHFSVRKHVLQYDDVMNTQREIIYKQRKEVLDGENLKDRIIKMMSSVVEQIVITHTEETGISKEGLIADAKAILNIELKPEDIEANEQELIEKLTEKVLANYDAKEQEIGEGQLREIERIAMLKVVDQKWMDHIDAMDELKDGIGLRAYGQKDPVVQYRIEGFDMFDEMVNAIKVDVVKILLHLQKIEKIERKQTVKITGEGLKSQENAAPVGTTSSRPEQNNTQSQTPVKNNTPEVGRNEPCPCGSGKKYKNCCGRNQ